MSNSAVISATPTTPQLVLDFDKDHHGYGHHNHGISDKDQTVFSATNAARDTHKTSHDVLDKVATTANDVAVAVEKNGRSGELTTQVAAGALGVSIQATAAATNLAIEKTAAATNLTTEKGIAATNLAIQVSNAQIQLLAVQNASAAALTAANNHSALLLEMCKCCCKTDELIRSEAGATRELMRSLNLDDVRAELAKTQMGVALANAKIATAPIVV